MPNPPPSLPSSSSSPFITIISLITTVFIINLSPFILSPQNHASNTLTTATIFTIFPSRDPAKRTKHPTEIFPNSQKLGAGCGGPRLVNGWSFAASGDGSVGWLSCLREPVYGGPDWRWCPGGDGDGDGELVLVVSGRGGDGDGDGELVLVVSGRVLAREIKFEERESW